MTRRRFLARSTGAVATLLMPATSAWAQPFPSRPIKLLTSGAAGSVPDTVGRLLGEYLSRSIGQSVVVEGRTGPGGIAAIQALQASIPDGHTLALSTISQIIFNKYLFNALPYEPGTDLTPISQIASAAMVIAVPAKAEATSIAELIKSASAAKEPLLVGTPPYGTPPHLVALKFLRATGLKASFVPFKSGPDAVLAAVRGDIHMVVDGPTILAPQVQEKSLRALAVTSRERSQLLPDVPTVSQARYPAAEAETWFGLVAPKSTPNDVVAALSKAVTAAIQGGEFSTKLAALGLVPVGSSPAAFAQAIASDDAEWKAVIRDAGLKPT